MVDSLISFVRSPALIDNMKMAVSRSGFRVPARWLRLVLSPVPPWVSLTELVSDHDEKYRGQVGDKT